MVEGLPGRLRPPAGGKAREPPQHACGDGGASGGDPRGVSRNPDVGLGKERAARAPTSQPRGSGRGVWWGAALALVRPPRGRRRARPPEHDCPLVLPVGSALLPGSSGPLLEQCVSDGWVSPLHSGTPFMGTENEGGGKCTETLQTLTGGQARGATSEAEARGPSSVILRTQSPESPLSFGTSHSLPVSLPFGGQLLS